MPTDMSRVEEVLTTLTELVGEDAAAARAVALKMADFEGTKGITQVLINRGLSKRTGAEAAKVAELESELAKTKDEFEAELTKANDELASAKAELTELRSKEPNWQRRVEETERRWQKKLDEATQETMAERRARLNDLIEIEKQKFIGALGLGREGGVEADWGRDVLPVRYADRFVPSEDGKRVKVLEIGETTEYDAQDGDPAAQLARDVLAKVPPKYRIMGSPDSGGDVRGGTGGIDKGTAAVLDTKARTGAYQL